MHLFPLLAEIAEAGVAEVVIYFPMTMGHAAVYFSMIIGSISPMKAVWKSWIS